MSREITLTIPDDLYRRLAATAEAARLSLAEVAVRSLTVGSPPTLEGVPAEYRADPATLASLSDDALWQIARSEFPARRFARLEQLLAGHADGTLEATEAAELAQLHAESNQLMLRRAYVYALLRWRGHAVPQMTG